MAGPVGSGTDDLEAEAFAGVMSRFEPFETAPHVAVAVSGGPDSLALLLLLERWVRARSGRLLALTVDHGLRPEAAAEAAWVARLCAGRGIAHRVLTCQGPPPAGGLQANARAARYRLLAAACGAEGILHLALAHQLEDQAETFLLRLAAGSGLEGLSAMPAVTHLDELRLLRPLLGVPRRRLQALLRGRGQGWLRDPSNEDPAYARVRLRAAAPALAEAGLSTAASAALAEGYGRLRRWSELAVAGLLAESCRLDPLGFAWLDRQRLLAAPEPLARLALARLLRGLGGRQHAPRGPKLDRLLARLRCDPPQAATLAGCRILPRRGDQLLVVREPEAVGRGQETPRDGTPWDRTPGTERRGTERRGTERCGTGASGCLSRCRGGRTGASPGRSLPQPGRACRRGSCRQVILTPARVCPTSALLGQRTPAPRWRHWRRAAR